MRIGVLAYGKTGIKLADQLKHETNSSDELIEHVLAFDTYTNGLKHASHIDPGENDNEHFHVYGKKHCDGTGTGGDAQVALQAADETRGLITKTYALQENIDNVDALVTFGSAGGGTGGLGATIAAEHLANTYPNTPLYAVTVLPDPRDPSVYVLNAMKTVQDLSAVTDSVIIFDNAKYGVGVPGEHPDYPSDADPDTVYETANAEMMEAFHTVFTADNASTRKVKDGSVINTAALHDVLRTGGITTISSVTDTLDRRDRSMSRWFWKLVPGGTPEHDRRTTEPAFPDANIEHDTGTENGDAGRVTPHPLDLLPYTHDPDASFLTRCTPESSTRAAYFLCAPKRFVNTANVLAASDWVKHHANDGVRAVKLYPGYSTGTTVKAVCVHSHTTVPARVNEAVEHGQQVLARVRERNRKQNSNQNTGAGDAATSAGSSVGGSVNPKDVNVFENSNTSL